MRYQPDLVGRMDPSLIFFLRMFALGFFGETGLSPQPELRENDRL